MTKENDLHRLADAAERIANALEKLAGVSAHQPQAERVVPMAGPLAGRDDNVFHAVYRDKTPACRISHGRQPALVVDLAQAVALGSVPVGAQCRHSGCASRFKSAAPTA